MGLNAQLSRESAQSNHLHEANQKIQYDVDHFRSDMHLVEGKHDMLKARLERYLTPPPQVDYQPVVVREEKVEIPYQKVTTIVEDQTRTETRPVIEHQRVVHEPLAGPAMHLRASHAEFERREGSIIGSEMKILRSSLNERSPIRRDFVGHGLIRK